MDLTLEDCCVELATSKRSKAVAACRLQRNCTIPTHRPEHPSSRVQPASCNTEVTTGERKYGECPSFSPGLLQRCNFGCHS